MNRRRFLQMAGATLGALAARPVWAQTRPAKSVMTTFVRVSPRDPRYFELTDGTPYIPIGFNLVSAPRPEAFERLVKAMADNRVNYCRIWLDQPPWGVEHARSGEYDPERAAHLDRFLSLCRNKGIRVKMCIEYFRNIQAQRHIWSDKPLHHIDNGGPFRDMADFLTSERGIAQFKKKLEWYARRYGDEPAIFAWELWNEMNAVRGDWRPWTKTMLPELRRLFPKNLTVQSLGSFDTDRVREPYRELCRMEGNDVAQVHRYLDLGASLKVCHGPVDVLAADAVAEMRAFNVRKPIILTETGAVKPKHTGASELYAKDPDGTLLHDMLFAPFFNGAAGTGHVWFWQQGIEQPNLWHHFARFAAAVEGIAPPSESFTPLQIAHPEMRIYALKGKRSFIAWCRDSASNWQTELVDGKKPEVLSGLTIDVGNLNAAKARIYDPWANRWTEVRIDTGQLALPDFRRSLVIRIDPPGH